MFLTRKKALELVVAALEMAETVPTDNDGRPIAAAVMMLSSGINIPVASAAMDGVKLASVNVASNKCSTVIAYACNTVDLADYDLADIAAAQAACPFFTNWDGGIRLLRDGQFVGALAVSGRSALGDRILAVKAANSQGFGTDFGIDGLTVAERHTDRDPSSLVDHEDRLPPA